MPQTPSEPWINELPPREDYRVTTGPYDRRLMEAMLLVCGEVGYAECSVQRVIGRARLSRTAFYKLFTDKEDCFARAYAAGVDKLVARILAAARRWPDWPDAVSAGLNELLTIATEQRTVTKCLLVEAHVAGGPALATRIAALERMAAELDRVRQMIPGEQAPPPRTASFVVGGIEAVVRKQLMSGDPADAHELLPTLVEFAIVPYLGAEAAREQARRLAPGGAESLTG